MRIVFMGTPEYAAVSLQALISNGYEVVGVFTQPDRPKGRGKQMAVSPVKALALDYQIPVFQPVKIRADGVEALKSLNPDLCVTAAFGQILSEEILAVPRLGTVNVHASLLPAYRGSSPANWVIINGEKITGVTTMMTDKGIDTGDILLQREAVIQDEETAGDLTLRLAKEGADLLIETLEKIKDGTCERRPQAEAESSYYPLLKKEDGRIDWSKSAEEIANLARGLSPWPGAFSDSPWGVLKILSARAANREEKGMPGDIVVGDEKNGLFVQTGNGLLEILTLQAPGGKAMNSKDFLRGHPLKENKTMKNEVIA
ncbi:MAG: methionyl-tRNA formyltransferase [Bacillota bacterium]|nr:methionyl-tRNA formyltransferase [Bacillota bacterium]